MAVDSSIPSPRQDSARHTKAYSDRTYAGAGSNPEISATAISGIMEISRLMREDNIRVNG